MKKNQNTIQNPERIMRILKKVCGSHLQVFMRKASDMSISVKAKMSEAVSNDEELQKKGYIRLGDVSTKGLRFLADEKVIQVEFLLMATKVVFRSKILKTDKNCLYICLPEKLVSIERRANERYKTNESMIAYVRMNVSQDIEYEASLPPVVNLFEHTRGLFPLIDVSIGGACIATPFPGLKQSMKSGTLDAKANLVLPMRPHFTLPIEVRWVKTVKEDVKTDTEILQLCEYRVGIEFKEISEDLKLELQNFMRQISRSEAI